MVDVCQFLFQNYMQRNLSRTHTFLEKDLNDIDNVPSRNTRIVLVICYQSRTVHVINHCVTQFLPCAIQYNSRVLIGIAHIKKIHKKS